MRIIDAHTHIFEHFSGIKHGRPQISLQYGKIKTGNQVSQFLPPSFERSDSRAEMLLAHMDCYGVEKAVLLPNIFYGYHNEYNLEAVNRWPDRFRALALVDVTAGEPAAEELDRLLDNPGFCGLKIEVESAFQFRPDLLLDDEELSPVFSVCNSRGAVVAMHLFKGRDVECVENLVKRWPKIRFVFCHTGAEAAFENARDGGDREKLTQLVARYPNAWYEVSTTPAYLANEYYPFEQGSRYVEKLCGRLGAEKLIWGSDYPGMLMRGTYRQLIDYVLKDAAWLTQEQKEKIMGQNAEELFFRD